MSIGNEMQDIVINTPLLSSNINNLIVNGVKYDIERVKKIVFTFEAGDTPRLDIEYNCFPYEGQIISEGVKCREVSIENENINIGIDLSKNGGFILPYRDSFAHMQRLQEGDAIIGSNVSKIIVDELDNNEFCTSKQFEDNDDYINNIKPMFVKKDK